MTRKKDPAAPVGDHHDEFPSEDWDTLTAWVEGGVDHWTALLALAHLLIYFAARLTAPEKATCLAATKGMRSETLARGPLAAEMRAAGEEAKAGRIDFATLFALLMKVLSLFPFI